jgi:hypothetical protein
MDRYYKFSKYLKDRFKQRVHKISVDADFSCPNKDGKISKEGCIYCDNRGFSFNTRVGVKDLKEQVENGIKAGKKRFKASKFILYFQPFTNTYGSIEVLKQKYDIIKNYPQIVGLSIATRPDCINGEILDLINSYTENYEVWIEYGLQSIHKKTLDYINRGHYFEEFANAIKETRKRKNIRICAHIIIGLPYEWGKKEDKNMILETARAISELNLDGIKIHPLHIIKGTKLEEIYKEGGYKPLSLDEYIDLVVAFLENLDSKIVIQRISADCASDLLIAPAWILNKQMVIKEIEKAMDAKDTFQGAKIKKD